MPFTEATLSVNHTYVDSLLRLLVLKEKKNSFDTRINEHVPHSYMYMFSFERTVTGDAPQRIIGVAYMYL